jgi:hypothetical protein
VKKRNIQKPAAKVYNFTAVPLSTAAPEIGTPTLGQVHRLEAKGLDPRRGRLPAKFREHASELKGELHAYLLQSGKPRKQTEAILYVFKLMKTRGIKQCNYHLIEREIVRPVYRQLGWSQGRKQQNSN